jgi:hypothetical protein
VDELVVVGLSEKRTDQKNDRRDALARAQGGCQNFCVT